MKDTFDLAPDTGSVGFSESSEIPSYLAAEADSVHLRAARMATLMHQAKSDEAKAFREAVLSALNQSKTDKATASGKRIRKPHAKEMHAHQQTMDAILGDLILASGNSDALGYCYRPSDKQAFKEEPTQATYRVFIGQIDALEDLGLIHIRKGYFHTEDWEGTRVRLGQRNRATRLRATPALLEMAHSYGITVTSLYQHYIRPKAPRPPVTLRGGKLSGERGKILQTPNTEQVAAIQAVVDRINAIYDRHHFEGMPEPHVRRVFNCADGDGFAFNKGGRLYDDYQNIRKEVRPSFRIDGQEVTELDLKASQLTILYGITKTPMPVGDPYHVEGLPRPIVKTIVTAMIGRGHTNVTRWPKDSRERLIAEISGLESMTLKAFSRRYPIKAVVKKVLRAHPVLHHLSPNKLDWADLQFIESEVLIEAILTLGELLDVPALPIHDSIIVPKRSAEIARDVLYDAFRFMVDILPTIEAKA